MELKKTSLYSFHISQKAKMVEFAGWEMPIQYQSIIEEHLAVRNHVGMFDVSHMGEIRIQGKDVIQFLEQLTPNFVADQKIGQIRYSVILNPEGGVKDDVTMFRENQYSFFLIVNAANTQKIYDYLRNEKKEHQVEIQNLSEEISMIALQGPKAEEIAVEVFPTQKNYIKELQYYHFIDVEYSNSTLRIARTGYTGEDGFEFLSEHSVILELWETFFKKGVIPCGLGARDSLRLEAVYPLYGNELDEEKTPIESGIGWVVKEKEISYYGKEKLLLQKKSNPEKMVIPFLMSDFAIPRKGNLVFDPTSGLEIGVVLSGSYSPILKKGIGTAFLPFLYKEPEKEIHIEIRGKKQRAYTIKPPFVKGSVKKK
ncbi:MAG: glycine cleavage system aminomethyltransferase GcvT [Leptospiraceae bacterium]|nr:glycine cleavage system aminomethyltransferase GcvT [Leptospiraceae bacterium]MDW7976285.1 glycine cleavage system aminomethyltransferase GcvT [Leptospiraceae bacterium]